MKLLVVIIFFFFSSRRRHTRYWRDWSSDVCSSDLRLEREHVAAWLAAGYAVTATDYEGLATPGPHPYLNGEAVADDWIDIVRSEERRVGEECRSRGSPYHLKKKNLHYIYQLLLHYH